MRITKTGKEFLIFALVLFVMGSSGLFAQEGETKALNGVQYSVIIPEDFSRFADYGDFRVGDKFVIAGQVMGINGAYLTIRNAGATNRFALEAPTRLELGTDVTVYGEISKVNAAGVETKIVKLESPKGNGQIALKNETRALDGVQYKVLQPEEYVFNIDVQKLKAGEKYVIDDTVMIATEQSATDTALFLRNTRMRFTVPQKISSNTAVRVYLEISAAGPSAEPKIVKLETR
jgi:hypothetical protein